MCPSFDMPFEKQVVTKVQLLLFFSYKQELTLKIL